MKECHLLDPMKWIIFNYMSEGLFLTPPPWNRTRVLLNAIRATDVTGTRVRFPGVTLLMSP